MTIDNWQPKIANWNNIENTSPLAYTKRNLDICIELLGQLTKEDMVEMISIGKFFRADDLFEAALKMTQVIREVFAAGMNLAWLG